MNTTSEYPRTLNLYPIVQDSIIIVTATLSISALFVTKPQFFQWLAWLMLAIVCGVSLYLLLFVKVSKHFAGWRKILVAAILQLIFVGIFLAGLVRVFYLTRPEAASVMPVTEYLERLGWPTATCLAGWAILLTLVERNRFDLVFVPARMGGRHWCVVGVGVTCLVLFTFMLRR